MYDPIDDLSLAIRTGFLDKDIDSKSAMQPTFVVNDRLAGTKILSYLIRRLEECDDFWISAAFLTTSGVAALHNALEDFSERNCGKGRIYVSDYLSFTQPEALRRISKFDNIDSRFLVGENFHGKGYLFRKGAQFDFLVGSTNLTANAMCKNDELNLHVSAHFESSVVTNFLSLFDRNFDRSIRISKSLLDDYQKVYEQRRQQAKAIPIFHQPEELGANPIVNRHAELPLVPAESSGEYLAKLESRSNQSDELESDRDNGIASVPIRKSEHSDNLVSSPYKSFVPNLLQVEAMENLARLRHEGNRRALVVSATGTGKTVLAGLDVEAFGAKRMLFVVHRRNIAMKAMKTFQQIFGTGVSMGLYSGIKREIDSEFIFCTVQTINNDEHLGKFDKNDFEYIIIDETHRAGAKTYQKLIDYFTPRFLLGMTATPERTDGFDIFSLFDHNIGCEIRLKRAMEEELLCPFHYFGVTDISIEGAEITDLSDFSLLVADERVNRVINALDEYGSDDGNARGLIFCSRVEEAETLSQKFNQKGYRTVALSGKSTEEEREQAIENIESDEPAAKLDYIFAVDVFNEGIDIPRLNQIIMLRPTQSAIIFVQQLGRGLRKLDDKDYLTVIDFIGNYQRNYLIPIALYGDRSLNKDTLRKLLSSGSSPIPGASTINFDRIAKERIFEAINSSNLQTKKDLELDYRLLKLRIGRKPMMMDFLDYESRDPYQYVEYSKSFYNFSISQEETESLNLLSEASKRLLMYFSKDINDGRRGIESFILKSLLHNNSINIGDLITDHNEYFGFEVDSETIVAALNCLNFRFHTERPENKVVPIGEIYDYDIVRRTGDDLQFGSTMKEFLREDTFKEYLDDSVRYSLTVFKKELGRSEYVKGFVRYAKYTRKDVFRLLNWDRNPVAQNVGGYIVSEGEKNCPIFVTYEKADHISETTKYEDEFVSQDVISWMSKSKRTLDSPDVKSIISQRRNGIRLPLFIKKSNDEGKSHYYMGELKIVEDSASLESMPDARGQNVSVVKIRFDLDRPVEEELYKYLTDA